MKTGYYKNINDCRYDIAEAQRNDKMCVVIDILHELDPQTMELSGVLFEELLIAQPKDGNEGAGMIKALMDSGQVDFLAITDIQGDVI